LTPSIRFVEGRGKKPGAGQVETRGFKNGALGKDLVTGTTGYWEGNLNAERKGVNEATRFSGD